MVLSGRQERVLLVFPRGADAILQAGGTIARLADTGSKASILVAQNDTASDHALWEMGAIDRAIASDDLRASVSAAIDAHKSSAIVVPARARDSRVELGGAPTGGTPAAALHPSDPVVDLTILSNSRDDALIAAAVAEAAARQLPVYLAVRGRMPADQRLIAVDVSDQLDAKAAALSTLPGISVDQRVVHVQGSEPRALSATEQFVMLSAGASAVEPRASLSSRLGAIVLGVIIGALFGAMGTVVHQSTLEIAGITVPWGLALALGSVTALLIGLRLVMRDRSVVLASALGLLVTIFVLSLRSTGGSVLVPAGILGTVWSFAPAIIAAIVIAWPRLPDRRVTRA